MQLIKQHVIKCTVKLYRRGIFKKKKVQKRSFFLIKTFLFMLMNHINDKIETLLAERHDLCWTHILFRGSFL